MDVAVDVEDLYGSPAETDEWQPIIRTGVEKKVSSEAEEEGDAAGAEELDRWRRRFSPAGVILRAEVDPDSWLTVGIRGEEMAVLFSGSSALMSASRPAIRLTTAPRLRLGGLLWPEARARIADSAWLTSEDLGEGRVISFVVSPVYRGSWRSTGRLLGNAVVLGGGASD